MKLFLLGRQTSNPILNRLPAMSHLSSLPDAVDEPSCFILNLDDPAQQDQLLVQIRKHPRWFAFPVFTVQPSQLSAYLSDGNIPDDLQIRIEQFAQRYQILKVDPEKGITERLLTYLWLRSGLIRITNCSPGSIRWNVKDSSKERRWLIGFVIVLFVTAAI